MATVRERKPGVWEVRAFTGRDERGRPTQVSRTVRGTKRDALRVAAELTVHPLTRAASATVAELLAQWVEQSDATWAPSTRRDQRSRAAAIPDGSPLSEPARSPGNPALFPSTTGRARGPDRAQITTGRAQAQAPSDVPN